MSNLSFVFPGQGSQSVGMLADLNTTFPVVSQTFAEASDTLGLDLWKLAQEGPKAELDLTHNTQPAMLTAGVAVWRLWREQGGAQPAVMAGHSLGEYTALVCAGALEFADAVRLVAERGRLMQEAVPKGTGSMAAILGLDDDAVRAVCADAAAGEVVEAVNFNAPGQVVVAGGSEAVERAVKLAKEAGAKRALKLPVSVPSHCALMKPAAEKLAQRLASTRVETPGIAVIHNASARSEADPEQIRSLLVQQLHSPVRWVETVRSMGGQGIETLLEAGPGKVLAGLNRRIDKSMQALPVFDPQSLEQALDACQN